MVLGAMHSTVYSRGSWTNTVRGAERRRPEPVTSGYGYGGALGTE